MEQEDTDVFEITDFTTASDWEIFISSLEEVINDWRLPSLDYSLVYNRDGTLRTEKYHESVEKIKFSDFEFTVTHYYIPTEETKDQPIDPNSNQDASNEWPFTFRDLLVAKTAAPFIKQHPLARWYNLRNFVILSASRRNTITGENRVKLLLSSIAIAANNTACQVPFFIHLDKVERDLYLGMCEGNGLRVDFEMVHLRRVPMRYRYLGGLLEMFQEKLNLSSTYQIKIDVSARFTYQVDGWPSNLSVTKIFGHAENDMNRFSQFSLGVMKKDPIEHIYITTTWPKVPHYALIDQASKLSPLSAPEWGVSLEFIDKPHCILGGTLRHFFKLCRRKETVDQLLSPELISGEVSSEDQQEIGKAFNRLTEDSVPTWNHFMKNAASRLRFRRGGNVPIDDEILNWLLMYLFPDAASEDEQAFNESDMKEELEDDEKQDVEKSFSLVGKNLSTEKLKQLCDKIGRHLKAAPHSSLTHRLAIALCLVNQILGSVHAVAHLWQEVLLELRYRWDHALPMAFSLVDGGSNANESEYQPDLGACRLHQKFQMFACCLNKRIASQSKNAKDKEQGDANIETAGEEEDTDDEFFECNENPSSPDSENVPCDDKGTTSDYEPDGRLKPFDNQCLLRHPDTPLYVPVTQQPGPMTEDDLEERAAYFTSLGTDGEGTNLRAKLQADALTSDMSSFKAANPGCVLEDFVRWYSPRDFIPDEEAGDAVCSGHLSGRMQVADNIWLETWHSAKPIPARLQKRLFDETKEAEKVFSYLFSLRPGEVAQQLLPCVFFEALVTLHKIDEPCLVDLAAQLDLLADQLARVSRTPALTHPNIDPALMTSYEDLMCSIARLEFNITCARSLKHKLLSGFEASQLSSDIVWQENVFPAMVQLLTDPNSEVILPGSGKGPFAASLYYLLNESYKNKLVEYPVSVAMSTQEVKSEECTNTNSEESPSRKSTVHFPEPKSQEFTLCTIAPRPSPNSRVGPQRMFCYLSPSEYRFAGATSLDTTFT